MLRKISALATIALVSITFMTPSKVEAKRYRHKKIYFTTSLNYVTSTDIAQCRIAAHRSHALSIVSKRAVFNRCIAQKRAHNIYVARYRHPVVRTHRVKRESRHVVTRRAPRRKVVRTRVRSRKVSSVHRTSKRSASRRTKSRRSRR